MGGDAAPGRRRGRCASTRRRRSSGWPGWSASEAEVREGQRDYAAAAAAAFAPRRIEGQPNMLLAEAGTGHRQDPGLSRPRLALGRERGRRGLGLDLHQGAPAPARPRGPAAVPRRGGAAAQGGRPQGPRELSLPAQPRGRAAGRLRRPRRDPRPARRALGGLFEGRRHGRRRPAGLASDPVPPRRSDRAHRPARRMRLCRLPALPQMLHRALGPGERRRRHRHRQPCSGDGQRRARPRRRQPADPDRLRRGPSSVRGRRFDLRRGADRAGGDRA